jgi:hypothetical protein
VINATIDRVFFYHGHGAALGGTITRPFNAVIQTQAAAAVPITGGHGRAQVGRFVFPHKQAGVPDVVSFDSAETEVTGSEQNGTYTTVVTTTVNGLNVCDVLTADKVIAKLTSTRNLSTDVETRVEPTGCDIKGLKILGKPVTVELDAQLFRDHDTHKGFRQRYNLDPQFRQTARKRFCWDANDNTVPQPVRERYKWRKQPEALTDQCKLLPCSLVKQVQCAAPGVTSYANVLIVPDFGTVYLAELLMLEHRRRVTMLRLQLGSPLDGTMEIGGGENNGALVP